jgi:hypothetical protein
METQRGRKRGEGGFPLTLLPVLSIVWPGYSLGAGLPTLQGLLTGATAMATKTARRPLSAKEHDARFRATGKRIAAIMKRMDEREKKFASKMREIERILNEL